MSGYDRVLLKLSGEVFGGHKGIGVDPKWQRISWEEAHHVEHGDGR